MIMKKTRETANKAMTGDQTDEFDSFGSKLLAKQKLLRGGRAYQNEGINTIKR
jgi:hypothetical protein